MNGKACRCWASEVEYWQRAIEEACFNPQNGKDGCQRYGGGTRKFRAYARLVRAQMLTAIIMGARGLKRNPLSS
ncbi:MAG: hypothetical protein ABF461_06615 [Zymomonas mobilis subsp. pomaceae]|uniref:hypothetical protein n=1 Tax=Zymomonas mobilis TaxID=542 RepID=UPI0002D27993|nr:hypothetical protein [Zymomonas mobilis]MDX5948227.1 hypothetical protein [Zymomonas mobilis subsp. pomaceae]